MPFHINLKPEVLNIDTRKFYIVQENNFKTLAAWKVQKPNNRLRNETQDN